MAKTSKINMSLKHIKIIVTCTIAAIAIISIYGALAPEISDFQITFRMLIKYFAMFISFSAGAWIFYEFFGVFFAKHKRKKLICGLLTAVVVALCIMWYILDHRTPTVVRMKEDVLYIQPSNV